MAIKDYMELTDEDLQAIKGRCEAATNGPWIAGVAIRRGYGVMAVKTVDNNYICDMEHSVLHEDEDGAFIASARSDIPALLGYIAAQQAALEQAWYVLDSASAGVAPKAAAVVARSHVEKFIGKRESNFDDAAGYNT